MSFLNIKKAMQFMQKELKKKWSKLTFEFTESDDSFTITASVTLNHFDDDIRVIMTANKGGGASFRAVFDKIEKTDTTLDLVDRFNESDPFFKAFIRNDKFLELKHFFIAYEVGMFKSYAGEFLCRLGGLADDEILLELAKYTFSE